MGQPVLQLTDIVRRYPNRHGPKGTFCEVLRVPHMVIHAGEVLGIVGHNGSGKSTLLRLLALLEAPDDGVMLFDGQPASIKNLEQRRQVTLLLQTPYLLSCSVASNVAYGLKVRGTFEPARVDEALRSVGLDPAVFAQRKRHELSGGEAQRVALASRLVLRPQVLLMDEPTASVDESSALRVAKAAKTAAECGSAVVIVSHDREWLDPLADRLIRFKHGCIDGASP